MSHEKIMEQAMAEAQIAVYEGNAPFGCLVTDIDGNILLKEHDRVNELTYRTAHGKVNAIRKLYQIRNSLSLNDCTFYTTSEPCPGCMAAMIKAKGRKVYYGAKTEADASLPIPAETFASYSTRDSIEVEGGILANECLKQREELSV